MYKSLLGVISVLSVTPSVCTCADGGFGVEAFAVTAVAVAAEGSAGGADFSFGPRDFLTTRVV
jgi:hypothetical protein